MIGVALKGLLGRKLRATLTAFAIVLGVAMISGAFILTDTLSKSFDGIYSDSYEATDAVISSKVAVKTADGDSEAPAFSNSVLTKVESLPGVHLAQGVIEDESRLVTKQGKAIGKAGEGVAIGIDPSADQSLNPLQLVKGQWPSGDGQIAIDKATAEKQHFAVGQTVGAFGDGPLTNYKVSGIVRFGTGDSLGGNTISVYDLSTAQKLFDKAGKFDLIRIGAENGVTDAELIRQINPLLSETTQVKTAADQASADSKESQEGLSFIKYFLLGFGGIALFVGSFVIANTLAITVAQRMRELATLRTLGASRRQVLGSVVLESVVIGLVGSIIGLFLGLAIAMGLTALLAATGVDLASGGLVFSTRTIVVSLGVGTLIALLASLRPAMRATRVEPISAVREGAVMPASRFARYAVATSAIVGTLAIGLFSYGVYADGLEIKVRIISLVAGVLLMFVGVAMIASRVVRPLAYVLGAPGARFGGTPGKLARQNAVRNPTRTASTAAAVMIGLALITFVAVIGQGFKSSFSSAVDDVFVADYAVSAGLNGDPLTNKAAKAVVNAPGVTAISEIRSGEAKVGSTTVLVTGVDANLTKVIATKWANGSDAVPAQLGRDGTFVLKRFAEDHSLKLGSPLTVKTPTGKTLRLHVDGIVDPPKGGSAVRRGLDLHNGVRQLVRRPPQPVHLPQPERRPIRSEHCRDPAEPRRIPGRCGRDPRRVQGDPRGRHRAGADDPLCAARPLGDREPVRRHQHARPLRLRAHTRARDAAGDRHDPAAGTPHDPAGERRHRADRRGARDRRRHVPRDHHDRRALAVRDRAGGALRDARRSSSGSQSWPECWPRSCPRGGPRS